MGHVLCDLIAQREDCRVIAGIDVKDGEQNGIPVYDSLDNDDDGRKSAISIYNSYKDKLFEKYGTTKESGDEGEKCIIYSGNNDVVLILSNKTGKSIGGEYRRYVDLGYSLGSISDEIVNQNEDEL